MEVRSFGRRFFVVPTVIPIPVGEVTAASVFYDPCSVLKEVFYRYFVRVTPRGPPANGTVGKSVLVPTAKHGTGGAVMAAKTVELILGRNEFLSSSLSSIYVVIFLFFAI